MCKATTFIDDQIRFASSLPTDIVKKFSHLSRKEISPHCETNLKPKEWTKAERIKYGVDEKEKFKQKSRREPMLKEYLKIPLEHANHPVK